MTKQKIITGYIIISVILIAFLSSCGSSRMNTCQSNHYHKTYNTKKNRSNYGQRYSYKTRSVKKEYVIKNGIAH